MRIITQHYPAFQPFPMQNSQFLNLINSNFYHMWEIPNTSNIISINPGFELIKTTNNRHIDPYHFIYTPPRDKSARLSLRAHPLSFGTIAPSPGIPPPRNIIATESLKKIKQIVNLSFFDSSSCYYEFTVT